jgi:hypothetical protein
VLPGNAPADRIVEGEFCEVFNAFPCVNLRLAIKRQVIGILRNQYMRQKAGLRQPTLHGAIADTGTALSGRPIDGALGLLQARGPTQQAGIVPPALNGSCSFASSSRLISILDNFPPMTI